MSQGVEEPRIIKFDPKKPVETTPGPPRVNDHQLPSATPAEELLAQCDYEDVSTQPPPVHNGQDGNEPAEGEPGVTDLVAHAIKHAEGISDTAWAEEKDP